MLNGIAHAVDNLVRTESDFGSERNFLEELAIAANGSDAKIGATEIYADGKIRHAGKVIRIAAEWS
jgi:hypothetical protein